MSESLQIRWRHARHWCSYSLKSVFSQGSGSGLCNGGTRSNYGWSRQIVQWSLLAVSFIKVKCGALFPPLLTSYRCARPEHLVALVAQVSHPVGFFGLPGLKVLAVWGERNFSILSGVHCCDAIKGKSSLSYENINVKSNCGVSWVVFSFCWSLMCKSNHKILYE